MHAGDHAVAGHIVAGARHRLSGAQAEIVAVPRRPAVAVACGLIWLSVGPASAEPVPGWSFATWSAPPATVMTVAETAKLRRTAVSADDAAMYGLPRSAVPFAFRVNLYGQAAVAYPIFRDGGLVAMRFVVARPATTRRAVLDGLTVDFGPGTADERGFSNVNWPATERFGLTVVVTDYQCWPLFSKPGL